MTGTPGEDGGSRAGETDDGSPGAGRGQSVEGRRGGVPAPDPWEQWLTRGRELWAATRRGAKRLWTAARPVLDQLRWSEPESSPVTIVDRRVAPTLLVPAQGQVYHFVVRATFTWSSDEARPELFGWYVEQFQPQAMQRLRRIAVRCAAEIPPDRPRAFALALDDAMTGDDALPWAYERGGVTFTCEPDVAVYLDEPVRKLLQPYWDQRIALEWKRDLDRRRAEYAEEQRGRRPADAAEDGAAPADGMPDALRGEHPTHQRESGVAGARRRPAEQGQRGPRPGSPVEQFTPLEPLLPPPGPPPPRPAPGQRPASTGGPTPASGDPDNPGPPDA
ncbi:hypothetical protein GCM10010169_44710 [Micromonospora fulviviridis]|uniref:hypothetical protein n=1 Tax=Micromonospora fulviviridis TaxID=47860 RepID=UPI001669732F|nr:hypothetical protein [Micromonospora fulviviridis]GGR95201.1 hypothetical protein GCM10010169_44710 [Micromonospora fulviviridis]